MKNALKTTIGCLLAATLLAGCEKNEAPQAASATDLAPLVPQVTGAGTAAGQAPRTALDGHSAMDGIVLMDKCGAALEAANARGASEAEFAIVEREACND